MLNFFDYIPLALRTESVHNPLPYDNGGRVLHAYLGLRSELAEVAEAGRREDAANYVEELGDCLWYLALACDALGIDQAYVRGAMHGRELGDVVEFDLDALDGAIADALKSWMFYGAADESRWVTDTPKRMAPLTVLRDNFCQYVIAVHGLIEAAGADPSNLMRLNICKLYERYPAKFEGVRAERTDLEAEYRAMGLIP